MSPAWMKVEWEGARAFREGGALDSNPYERGEELYLAWRHGWLYERLKQKQRKGLH